MDEYEEYVYHPPIKKDCIVEQFFADRLKEIRFTHFTGKVLLHVDKGTIVGIEEEVLDAPKEEA